MQWIKAIYLRNRTCDLDPSWTRPEAATLGQHRAGLKTLLYSVILQMMRIGDYHLAAFELWDNVQQKCWALV